MNTKNMLRLAALVVMSTLLSSCASKPVVWTEEERNLVGSATDTMRVLTIETPEDLAVLRSSCSNFSIEELQDPLYAKLERLMVATVTSPSQNGVGIAGPQVGLTRRVVAVQRLDKEGEPFEVYPNIEIIERRGEKELGSEGCLSVPGLRGEVMRWKDIDIRYTSPKTLQDTVETIQGFTAVIFQHETDHLDGVLYTDCAVSTMPSTR